MSDEKLNPVLTLHLARSTLEWVPTCQPKSVDPQAFLTWECTLREHTVTCEDCLEAIRLREQTNVELLEAAEPVVEEPAVAILDEFPAAPFDAYDRATLATSIYPGAGTGDSNAVAYLTAGLINEVGEACEKILPVLIDTVKKIRPGDDGVIPLVNLIALVRGAISIGKEAHVYKKSLRRGEFKLPRFRAFTRDEADAIADEFGDVLWYVVRGVLEIARWKNGLVSLIWRNVAKLRRRKEENKLEGEGDKR